MCSCEGRTRRGRHATTHERLVPRAIARELGVSKSSVSVGCALAAPRASPPPRPRSCRLRLSRESACAVPASLAVDAYRQGTAAVVVPIASPRTSGSRRTHRRQSTPRSWRERPRLDHFATPCVTAARPNRSSSSSTTSRGASISGSCPTATCEAVEAEIAVRGVCANCHRGTGPGLAEIATRSARAAYLPRRGTLRSPSRHPCLER